MKRHRVVDAAVDAMKAMIFSTQGEEWFSSGMYSANNPYGIDQDLVFSFPVRLRECGEYEIVKGLNMDTSLQKMIQLSERELIAERDAVRGLLQ